jgi:hypothetical protein
MVAVVLLCTEISVVSPPLSCSTAAATAPEEWRRPLVQLLIGRQIKGWVEVKQALHTGHAPIGLKGCH